MDHTIHIGRWAVELHWRAIYLQQRPKPDCTDCAGRGTTDYLWQADSETCPCWDPYRTKRIPLWRRAKIAEPF